MSYLGKENTALQTLSDGERTLQLSNPIMEGADVRDLQKKLKKHGYSLPQYGVDGQYGEETEMAVKEFQQDNNLPITGVAGPKTLAALNEKTELSKTPGLSTITGFFNNTGVALQEAKSEFWDPLPTNQKMMYSGGSLLLVIGIGVAIANKD